ncbi:MAG: Lrp/AsnC family transcriptional regulator [Clostridiales bacterium]|nr:Lrp/AsnC family transcriptional regulator [Clostridiales bacterium]MDY2834870.1 Lrp/AsnC family transcriptional regulator [Candidatus Aphodomonas sp.]
MDQIDSVILSCLSKNARMRASEIAELVGMSVSSVGERIRKLERSGVIQQYTVKLDPTKLNRSFQAIIGIQTEHPRYIDYLTEALMDDPNVVECVTLTGDMDFMARVSATSPEHFQQIHHRISQLEGVKGIKSYYILGTRSNPKYNPVDPG